MTSDKGGYPVNLNLQFPCPRTFISAVISGHYYVAQLFVVVLAMVVLAVVYLGHLLCN